MSDGAVVVLFIGSNVSFERAVDLSVVDGGFFDVGLDVFVKSGILFRWVDGSVGLVRADEEEVGFVGIGAVFHPGDGFCHDGIAIPLADFAHFFAIADPAVSIFGAVEGVDGGAKPVVEAVVARVRLAGEFAQVPFADEAGVVTLFLEKSGEGHFFLPEVTAFWSGNGVESGAIGGAAGEEAGARGGTDRAGGVTVGEADPFFGEGVKVRSLDDGAAVATEVSIAEVIGEVDDDVGWSFGGGREGCG